MNGSRRIGYAENGFGLKANLRNLSQNCQSRSANKERQMPFVSACCQGEWCHCGEPAEHKVEETIFSDDPIQQRHPLTAYICHKHFREIMGSFADNKDYRERSNYKAFTLQKSRSE